MNKELLFHYLSSPQELPQMAMTTLPSDNKKVIIVKNGEKGYYPHMDCKSVEEAKTICEHNNSILGVTEEQKEALSILSMRK